MEKISVEKFASLKAELKDVIDVFLDEEQDGVSTGEVVKELYDAGLTVLALNGLDTADKAKVVGVALTSIGQDFLEASVVE